MSKTYFASDTHFSHPNILKYEPQRIRATVHYIMEMGLEIEILDKLDELNKKYGNKVSYIAQYIADVVSQAMDARDFIISVCNNLLDYNNYYDEEMSEEEVGQFKQLQQEQIKVLLHYHDEMLIQNWNSIVGEDDTIYFLGDLAFKNRTSAEALSRRLNGYKTIILGNHDGKKYNEDGTVKYSPVLEAHFKACGFERVEFNPIVLKGHFILSHEPLNLDAASGYFNIYGHVHSDPRFATQTANSLCCCLDRWRYAPIEIEGYNDYKFNQQE